MLKRGREHVQKTLRSGGRAKIVSLLRKARHDLKRYALLIKKRQKRASKKRSKQLRQKSRRP